MIYVLISFLLAYVIMLLFPKYKLYTALFMALAFSILGIISYQNILKEIDFNVLMMIGGTMGTVSLFIESKMPNRLADTILSGNISMRKMTLLLALFAGGLSAFVDNVATVLMIAPVILIIAKKLKVNPVPIIISMAIFSNLEGAATLVGDTTAIMLAGAMKMDFLDFFFYEGKIGLFFIVQIGLLISLGVLFLIFRHQKEKVSSKSKTIVHNYIPTYLLILTILTLIMASFIPNKPSLTNGIICLSYFIIGLIIKIIQNRSWKSIISNLKDIDYETLLFLTSLFVIIGGIKESGVIDLLGEFISGIGNSNPFVIYTVIVFISVIVSAFVDNIPYVATMLPVILSVSLKTGINPTPLYYGLIIGATLGGNFTPIGASTNITAIGLLRKNGYEVGNRDYFKLSVPLSLAAVLSGYIIVILLYM